LTCQPIRRMSGEVRGRRSDGRRIAGDDARARRPRSGVLA
jgi:hypothetical protein